MGMTFTKGDNMANRITAEQAAFEADYDSIDACVKAVILYDEDCPALCSEGCTVEVDGTCPHGFPSIIKEVGYV